MKLDLSVLFDNKDKIYPFSNEIVDFDLNERLIGLEVLSPIKYSGQIIETVSGYYVDVGISYRYKTECARCLKTTIEEVETNLSGRLEEYEKSYEEEIEEELDENLYDDPIYYKDGYLELDDYVLMQVASSLPMKTLCDDNCKGLCIKCGINLNKETCDCDTDFIDPRLEKLKNLVIDN